MFRPREGRLHGARQVFIKDRRSKFIFVEVCKLDEGKNMESKHVGAWSFSVLIVIIYCTSFLLI